MRLMQAVVAIPYGLLTTNTDISNDSNKHLKHQIKDNRGVMTLVEHLDKPFQHCLNAFRAPPFISRMITYALANKTDTDQNQQQTDTKQVLKHNT